MSIRIAFLIVVFLASPLVQGQTDVPETIRSQVIKISSNRVDSLNASIIFEKMEFVRLSNDQLVGKISKVNVLGNQIYILDKTQNAILCFDLTGRFINKFAKVGRGPDEYWEMTDFDIDPDRGVILALTNSNRLVELDSKLNPTDKQPITANFNTTNILSLNSETLLYFAPMGIYKEDKKEWESSELVFQDLKNKRTRQAFFNSRTIKIGLDPGQVLYRSDSLVKTSFLKYSIYLLNQEGITSVLEPDFGNRSVDKKTFDNLQHLGHLEKFLDPSSPTFAGKVTSIKSAYFVNNILFFESVIEGRSHYTFYSFKDQRSYLSLSMRNDLIGEIPFGRVRGANNNCIITYVEPSSLIKDLRKQGKTSRYGISEMDNPIICLFYVKK
jgi:hypothetical protein